MIKKKHNFSTESRKVLGAYTKAVIRELVNLEKTRMIKA